MRVVTVTNVTFRQVLAESAREHMGAYHVELNGGDARPGRIVPGPGVDNNTTVGLVEGDDGGWIKNLAIENGGTYKEDTVWTDEDKNAMEKAIEIMCTMSHGTALNAVIEDYPRLWALIGPLKDRELKAKP